MQFIRVKYFAIKGFVFFIVTTITLKLNAFSHILKGNTLQKENIIEKLNYFSFPYLYMFLM